MRLGVPCPTPPRSPPHPGTPRLVRCSSSFPAGSSRNSSCIRQLQRVFRAAWARLHSALRGFPPAGGWTARQLERLLEPGEWHERVEWRDLASRKLNRPSRHPPTPEPPGGAAIGWRPPAARSAASRERPDGARHPQQHGVARSGVQLFRQRRFKATSPPATRAVDWTRGCQPPELDVTRAPAPGWRAPRRPSGWRCQHLHSWQHGRLQVR